MWRSNDLKGLLIDWGFTREMAKCIKRPKHFRIIRKAAQDISVLSRSIKTRGGRKKHFLFVRKRSLVMVMRIMIKIITILVMIYTIIMKNLREEDKNISSLWGKGVWCRQRATKASVPFNNGSNQWRQWRWWCWCWCLASLSLCSILESV